MAFLLLFSKVRLCDCTFWSLFFKKLDCAIALFGRSFQKCNCAITLFCIFQTCNKICNRTIALSKRANVGKKCEFSYCTRLEKRDHEIALSKRANERKWAKKSKFPNRTFFERLHIFKRGNCLTMLVGKFAHWKKLALFWHIRSFQKCDCMIVHFLVALMKSVIALFGHSFQKCDCAIALFLHFSKVQQNLRSHNCSLEKSECAKMWKKCVNFQIALFCTLKRAITHFQSVWLPNPGT